MAKATGGSVNLELTKEEAEFLAGLLIYGCDFDEDPIAKEIFEALDDFTGSHVVFSSENGRMVSIEE